MKTEEKKEKPLKKKKKYYIQHPIEGADGKPSSRKIIAFIASGMLITSWVYNVFYGVQTDPIILYGLIGIISLAFGLITAQNITDIIKNQGLGGLGGFYNPGCHQ